MSVALQTTIKSKDIAVSLNEFATPFDENYKSFGVYYNGKAIVSSCVLEALSLTDFDKINGQKIHQVFYQNGFYLLLCQDKTVYLYHKEYGCKQLAFAFDRLYAIELPDYFEGMLLSDKKSSYFFANNGELQKITIPAFQCGCYFYDRLILCLHKRIYFSNIGDSFCFEEGGGNINLVDKKEKILATIPYGEQIYLFRTKGIDILTISGAEAAFKVKSLLQTATIAESSINLANDGKIYFYTQDGLYTFKNQSIQKMNMHLEQNCIFTQEMPAVYNNNCYYIQAKTKMEEKSCLYAIYPNAESIACIANGVDRLSSCHGCLFVILDGKIYTKALYGEKLQAKREIRLQVVNPFDNDGLFKSIKVNALHEKRITIQSQYGIRRKYLRKEQQNMAVNLRGTVFTIAIESEGKIFHLKDLQLQFTTLQGVRNV